MHFLWKTEESSRLKVVGPSERFSEMWLNASGLLALNLFEQLLSSLCFVCSFLVGDKYQISKACKGMKMRVWGSWPQLFEFVTLVK